MKKLLLSGIAFTFFSPLGFAKQKITIASEEYPRYAEKNGSGVYWELFKKIFKDYDLQVTIKPFTRSAKMLEKGEIDIVIPLYEGDIENALFPKQNFDVDNVAAFYKKSRIPQWKGYQPQYKYAYEVRNLSMNGDVMGIAR